MGAFINQLIITVYSKEALFTSYKNFKMHLASFASRVGTLQPELKVTLHDPKIYSSEL